MIEANVDAYGSYARGSALADYLELLALQGRSMTQASLADRIADTDWGIASNENFRVPGAVDKQFDAPDERVYGLIRERADILDARYPFAADNAGRLTASAAARDSPYAALLCMTLAHAYRVECPEVPDRVFEQTVTDVLADRGWAAVNFSEVRRARSTFEEALEDAGVRLGIRVQPDATSRSMSAQDAGVDAIAHLPWCLKRPGRWTFIGQVTCAMSNEWSRKMREPSPPKWSRFLGESVSPIVFLAVPHHSEARHRLDLMNGSQAILLDRLSLVMQKNAVTQAEAAIRTAVIAEGIE